MRPIEEITREELLEMTAEDCKRWIQLRMAEDGVPILQKPEEPSYPHIPEEDLTLFTADFLGELAYEERNELLKVIDVVRSSKTMHRAESMYGLGCKQAFPGYANKYGNGVEAFDVKEIKARSLNQMAAVTDLMADKKALETAYNKELKAYEASLADAQYIRKELYDAINEAKAFYNRRKSLKSKLAQYLELANGDGEIAMRFLGKVEELSEEVVAYLLAE